MTAMNEHAGVLLIVRFKSSLPAEELQRRYKERMPLFRDLPGLLQKFYVYDPASQEWGGVYLWESQEALERYAQSDLRKSIPEVYQIVGTPRIEPLGVIDILRPELV